MQGAPDPTPPKETAKAATGTNINTAVANSFMQNMNETTPFGSKSVTQTGSKQVTDPYTGETYSVPTFSVEQTLSDQEQRIYDANADARYGAANLANTKMGEILGRGDLTAANLNTDINTDFSADRQRVEEALMSRMNPQLDRDRETLRTSLINQGITEGTEAFDRAMNRADQASTDARMQAILAGGQEQSRIAGLNLAERGFENNARQQDFQNRSYLYNQPVNEMGALLGTGQVNNPSFMTGAGAAAAPTTDVASVIGNYDQQKMNQWQQNQAMMGSLFGGIGSIGAAILSDERVKTDKDKIGQTEDGLGIYSFRYRGEPQTHIGFMAQEVRKKKPGAVIEGPDGLLRVDYGRAV